MALNGSFQELALQLQNLSESLVALRTITVEDKPVDDDVILVELFSEAIDDMLGWLEGALQAFGESRQALKHPVDLNQLWRSLSACQQRFNHVQQSYATDLVSYERLSELNDFAERRGGEWLAWADSVKASLDDCREPIYLVTASIFACWQEIGERIGIHTIHVQTTNISQHLALGKERC